VTAGLLLLLALGGDVAAAEQALAAGEPRKAIELAGGLEDPRAMRVVGRAHLQLREYEAAVEPLLRALEAAPEDKELLRDAAWACWGAAATAGSFAQAFLEDALRLARRAEDARLAADLLYELGRWDEALDAYRQLPVTDRNRYHLATRRGHCLAALGREDEAKTAYGEALDEAIRRGDLEGAYRSAFRAGRTGKLLAWLDTRVAAAPDDVMLRLHRGYAREALQMWREAVEDLRAALRLRPDHVDARRRLARALVFLGSKQQSAELMAEAEAMLRARLKEDPSDDMTWSAMQWLGGWAWANGDTRRACEVFEVMLAVDPGDRNVVLNFTAMARRLGRYDEAEAAFRAALEDDPEDPVLLNDFAILEDGRGREERAIELWEKVHELDPANMNALENLFTKAWERGDAGATAKYLQLGLAEARNAGDPGLLRRWRWFRDRLEWAPAGFGKQR